MKHLKLALEIVGAGLLIAGVAMVWVPAALMVAGLACLAAARPA